MRLFLIIRHLVRFITRSGGRDLGLDYERVARDVIRSLDPIRLIIIENLALFDDNDEDLVDFKLNECVDTHRRLIMRINNPELNDSNDSDNDIGDDWRR